MSVDFDASTELEVTANLSDPTTWTHTPSGTPRGVVVGIVHDGSVTDIVNGVTYGGVALSEAIRTTVSSGKIGAVELWFRGDSIPTGPQSVSVDLTGTGITDNAHFVAVTLTGDGDLEIVDSGLISDVQDNNPAITLAYLGRLCTAIAMIYSGRNSPTLLTENAGCTRVQDYDLGVSSSVVARQTTPGSTNFTIGWTALGAEVAMVAMSISEAPSGEAPQRVNIKPATGIAVQRVSRW